MSQGATLCSETLMPSPAVFALLPCLVVIVAILGFRASGLQAAGAALTAALVLFGAGMFGPPAGAPLVAALADGAVLTLLVAATVVPGVLFVEAARKLDADAAINRLVAALQLPPAQIALLITFGIGVTVESLTGMGVSLLVTVPLLSRLMPRRAAIVLALIGMSLMPWGALSLSATVGAKLGDIPIDTFARLLWQISGPVAVVLPLLAVLAAGAFTQKDVMWAIAAGAVLWAAIGLISSIAGVELAGVAGGLAVLGLMMMVAVRGPDFVSAVRAPGLMPYAILVVAVVVQKVLVVALARRGVHLTLATERVSFSILTSPGVALLAAVLLVQRGSLDSGLMRATVKRCWRAVATTLLFMLTARLLVSAGGIDALAATVAHLGGSAALVATAVLGAIGGFVTGSGVSGNALFLPSAATTGAFFGAREVFAVVSNSAAGHTAMTSLPVVAILLAALPDRTAADERMALRSGLMLAALYVAVVTAAGLRLM